MNTNEKATFKDIIAELETKYGMKFDEFSDSLGSHSTKEDWDDWREWRHTIHMYEVTEEATPKNYDPTYTGRYYCVKCGYINVGDLDLETAYLDLHCKCDGAVIRVPSEDECMAMLEG